MNWLELIERAEQAFNPRFREVVMLRNSPSLWVDWTGWQTTGAQEEWIVRCQVVATPAMEVNPTSAQLVRGICREIERNAKLATIRERTRRTTNFGRDLVRSDPEVSVDPRGKMTIRGTVGLITSRERVVDEWVTGLERVRATWQTR